MPASRNPSDFAESVAVMGGDETAPHHSNSAVVVDRNSMLMPPGSGHKPSHARPNSKESLPPHNLQIVCPLSLRKSRALILFCSIQRYNTIVKGFKALEAKHEEFHENLATSEEMVRAYAELLSEAEVGQTVMHSHEQVRRSLGEENFILNIRQEIQSLREEMGRAQEALNDRDQVCYYIMVKSVY